MKIPKKKSKKIQKIKKHHYRFLSSQYKLGKAEKEKKKKSLRWVPTRPVIENTKKIAKIFKNLKNTIMASLQAKISWERSRKRENKNKSFRWVRTRPVNENSKKKSKKIQKIKKHHYCFFSSQYKLGKAEKERKKKNKKKKKIVQLSSYPTRNRKFQKIAKKN